MSTVITDGNQQQTITRDGTPYSYDEESKNSILNIQQNIATSHGYPIMSEITSSTTSFSVKNDNPTYTGGAWTAVVENGTTYYVSTSTTDSQGVTGYVKVEGPINIIGASSFTVNAGAVVDGLVLTGTSSSNVSITNKGTIQNSFIANAMIPSAPAGSVSQGNTYFSTYVYGIVGTSNMDVYYNPASNSSLDLSGLTNKAPSTSDSIKFTGVGTSIACGGTKANVNIYVATDNSSSTKMTFNAGATVGCFLAGTMIETSNGFKAVENIKVGDQVITYHDDQKAIHSIIWVGHNKVSVKSYLPEDLAGYPIRILKNAIDENVPSKDLLVTPEHSIVLEGKFVPARMLVNGSTIFYDRTITEYVFYHIETKDHSIISADNVLTESYLDTGNRSYFISDDDIVRLSNKAKEWNVDSAAPLGTNREFVEPIYMGLVERAKTLGFESSLQDMILTEDSNLRILTNFGEVISAHHQNEKHCIFKIPSNVTRVWLMSRTSCPSQVIGSYVDDRRDLGVLVGRVTLLEGHKTHSITEHYDAPKLKGWDVQEQTACRWTNGNAMLNIRAEQSDKPGMLVIEVLAAGPYLLEEESLQRSVA